MYFHEPIYDLDILSKHNLHIHTNFSKCAKEKMTVSEIIKTAETAGLEMIALTDHFNDDISDSECIERNIFLRAEAAKTAAGIRVLFGNELSAYAPGKTLESQSVRDIVDYRLYSCNHYHLDFWGQPKDKSARGYAEYSIAIISSLIKSDFADCIAHPFIGRFIKHIEDRTLVTKAMTDSELGDLLMLGNAHYTAWELNTGAILGDPEFGRRLWNLGRETGAVFNYGTDSHRFSFIDTSTSLPEIKKVLN